MRLAWLLLAPLAFQATACHTSTDANSVHTEEISKSTFKGTWPLIPESGVLACRLGAVTFTPAGSNDTYAVNAIATNWAAEKGWRKDFEHIWLTAAGGQNDTPGVLRVPLFNLMDEGLNLCGPPWAGSASSTMTATSQTFPDRQSSQVELPFTNLRNPNSVAVDTAGNVYVTEYNISDVSDNRVLKLPAGSTTQVELPFTGLQSPSGVAVDTVGNVYITDDRVLKLPAGSNTQVELAFTGLNTPFGPAVDTAGNVYITDGDSTNVSNPNFRVLKLAAGSNTQVKLPFTGLKGPTGVAVDTAGNTYVTDNGNNRVLKLPAE
jgi:nicotinamide mononucleotide (NMN) deamidase PncC